MGAVSSKSPLERRNTVARRSQRRSIHSIKAKADKLFQNVKKFKGVDEEDDNYKSLRSELEHTRNELHRKAKDLQPQIRNIYDNTANRIEEAFKALESKLKENQEKAQKKEQENLEKAEKKKEKKKKDEADNDTPKDENQDADVEVKEVEEEPNAEAGRLEQTTEKRKTVELKFVQIIPDDVTQVDIHSEKNNNIAKSPEETRKSILKVGGVAVLPGAVMNEISARASTPSKAHFETDSETIISKINHIIEQLQAIEYQIADFVGKKNGTQYSRIKDRLLLHLDELALFNTTDDYALEQIKICKNYVGSCLNFLDEKSVDDQSVNLQDDVFLPANNDPRSTINSPTSISPPPVSPPPVIVPPVSPPPFNSLSPVDARAKLQRLSKTTAI